jgi:hypothetical protein
MLEGIVIGMITDVNQGSALASQSEAIELYVNGIIPNLMTLSKPLVKPNPDVSAGRDTSTNIGRAPKPAVFPDIDLIKFQDETENRVIGTRQTERSLFLQGMIESFRSTREWRMSN